MTFALLLILIVFSAIASLATLILGIIHLATGKNRSGLILGVSFIMTFIISVLCIMEVVKRGSNKVKEGIEWVKSKSEKNNNDTWTYNQDMMDSIMIADSLEAISRDSAIMSHSPSQMEGKHKGK